MASRLGQPADSLITHHLTREPATPILLIEEERSVELQEHDSSSALFDLRSYAAALDSFQAHSDWSDHSSPREALDAIFDGCDTQSAAFAVVFFSAQYDPTAVADAIISRFQCPVLACTTAGEITSAHGYKKHGIAAAALHGVEARNIVIRDVSNLTLEKAQEHFQGAISPHYNADNTIAMLAIDGLSMAEERVAALLNSVMEGLPLVGGSAGDDLKFGQTLVFDGQGFIADAAVVTVVHNPAGIRTFVHEHFEPTDYRGVITAANTTTRVIEEIDGWPAADEYAKAIGTDRAGLTQAAISSHPLMIRTNLGHFVRSIQQVQDDGSLQMYCAIDEGMIVGVGNSRPIVGDTNGLYEREPYLQSSKLVIGYDCILRRIEAESRDVVGEMNQAISRCPFIGFSTYGEQYMGLHINQTLAGAAFLGGAA